MEKKDVLIKIWEAIVPDSHHKVRKKVESPRVACAEYNVVDVLQFGAVFKIYCSLTYLRRSSRQGVDGGCWCAEMPSQRSTGGIFL